MSTYQLYHSTYTSAIQSAEQHITDSGFEVSADELMDVVGFGPAKPQPGKTNSLHLKLTKNGKLVRVMAHLQVYNRGQEIGNCYELNVYVS